MIKYSNLVSPKKHKNSLAIDLKEKVIDKMSDRESKRMILRKQYKRMQVTNEIRKIIHVVN
jgi:hypothetical protein